MYSFRSTLGPVDLAFTDRLGGVSAAPYDELNLSLSGEDDAAAKAENHRLLMADFASGEPYADVYQVHSARVDVLEDRIAEERPEADGIVSTSAGRTLLVRAADCVPVLLADPDRGVIAAAHAGRNGVHTGVVTATVTRMRDLGAAEVTAWIGPHICGRCYEVPRDMQDEVAAEVPETRATTSWGTPSLDLGAGVRAQLERAGATVVDAARCTLESPDLYSYRRDGARAGRLAGVIRRRPA